MKEIIKKPSWLLHFTEVFRATLETLRGYWYVRSKPAQNIGRGIPVMVVPGLLSTDWATIILRKYLSKLGFNVQGWEMGMNLGRMESLHALKEKVKVLSQETNQPIILIGWSMGGIFSREVAKEMPEYVRQLITIGSPFANVQAPNHAKWVFDLLNSSSQIDEGFTGQLPNPAKVQTLCLYSKRDGVVPWQVCMESCEDDLHRSQEIKSSHFGMGANPSVLRAVRNCVCDLCNSETSKVDE